MVQDHSQGSKILEYNPDLGDFPTSRVWDDDRYYLFGKLEALDAPGEWFLDREKNILYFWPPDNKNPENHLIEAKSRDYGFDLHDKNYIEIVGFNFMASTVRMQNCNHSSIKNCRFSYPSYSRKLPEVWKGSINSGMVISGNYNSVLDCIIAYTPVNGLVMKGSYNTAKNKHILILIIPLLR